MLITGFAAGMFQTNCYLLATEAGSEAVIVDPGQDAAVRVRELLAEHDLTPVAVLLTHGHLDHTWN
ncbi:MBL fold metallo-hydrolase, partial [Streptomyces sp. SID10244]|nr:MBL fold metallo-hydrolase [Streptomyces sp. SID10244]